MGETITINYDSLFDLLRREKSREELQKIEDSFYRDVADFLNVQEKGLFSLAAGSDYEKGKIQISNIKKLLRELYEKRERKIVNLAVYKVRVGSNVVDLSALLPEEQILFERLCLLLAQGREGLLEQVAAGKFALLDLLQGSLHQAGHAAGMNGQIAPFSFPEPAKQEQKLQVTLLIELPEFLGRDLEVYGPFKAGERALISKSIAEILVGKAAAEFVHDSQ